MIKYTILAAILWAVVKFLDLLDFISDYEKITAFAAQNGILLVSYCTLASAALVGLSFTMRALNFFGLMYVFSKLLLEVSQFAIAILSVFSIIIWFDLQMNLWRDLGFVAIMPFEILGAACMCIHLFDFNIPLLRRFLTIISLPIITGAIILLTDILGVLK